MPNEAVASEAPATPGTAPRSWPRAVAERFRCRRRGAREVAHRWATYDDVTPELEDRGVEVRPFRVDVEAFRRYVEESGYRDLAYFDGGGHPAAVEKWLEHYVSLELTAPRPGETLIDVASDPSPFPDVARERFGVRALRQDRIYPEGLHGDRLGGDAVDLPLDGGSADVLTLHCSFEHFEGDRDRRFLREAERLLVPGGRLCILPLYTSRAYSIQTDLAAWHRGAPELDPEALTCIADGWGEMHGRMYDARRFLERVAAHLGRLELRLYRLENLGEVSPACYLKLAALFTRR